MKKIYTLCIVAFIICTCSEKSNASTVVVNVEDFQFNPAEITISTGDQVMWMWTNSVNDHTTTSTTIPAGAVPWDEPINASSPMFTYTATIPGSYNYLCSFHSSMGMIGHMTVLSTTGIAGTPSSIPISLHVTNPVTQELGVTYGLPKATRLSIRMYNIIGNEVSTFISASQPSGLYTQTFSVSGLNKGIYVITLETPEAVLSKRVIIQ